jgi:GT2 family glycosyltransferase
MKHEWNPWTNRNWSATREEWDNADLPLVTLGVLNYNRRVELRQTLDVLTRAVQYPRYEILVVDNGSTDGSIEMVRREYPSVIIYEVGENRGVSARNFMTPLARGKYLFHFDDDTCPGSPAMVLRIVQHMEANPDIAALSTSYYQPVNGLMETIGWEDYRLAADSNRGFKGIFIVEGGVCFRISTLRKVGGYDPAWPGQEGMELGLRFLKHGYDIVFCPWFLTLHFYAASGRPHGRRAYVNSRQTIWMIAKHWPLLPAIPLWTLLVFRKLLAMAMHRDTLRDNARGLWDGFRTLRPFLRYKPKLTLKQALRLKRWYLFLFRWA